uniref:Aquaporin 8 n=1 Tax=Magallana hongkongensis TaxID=2653900 RepID=A0A0D3QFT5_MAGHO|nr:aquaporin 8 [Crassostrea hongkongensis]
MSESNDFIIEEEKVTDTSIFESRVRPILAEFMGSIILVSVVCAGAINTESISMNAVIYGFTMMFLIITFGEMSGGYFNPVITLGFTLARVLSIPQAVCYFFAQIIGGIVGAALVRASYLEGKHDYVFNGYHSLWFYEMNEIETQMTIMLSEARPTFILVLTVLITTLDRKKRWLSPLAIGFSIIVCSYTSFSERRGSTSMNPLLRFGPAVAYSGRDDSETLWKIHYVYWIGPIVGTLVASLLYRFVFALGSRRIRIQRPCCKKQPCYSEGNYTNKIPDEFGNIGKNVP